MKIFLDANIFIATCGSETGASRYLFRVAEFDESLHLVTNVYAVTEAKRNVGAKMNDKMDVYSQLITRKSLTIAQEAPQNIIQLAMRVIVEKDVPILAGAIFAQADILCTLDQNDFHTTSVRRFAKGFGMRICLPKDVLVAWRKRQVEPPSIKI